MCHHTTLKSSDGLPVCKRVLLSLSHGKMSNKNVQLVSKHCRKTSWKAMLGILPPLFKLDKSGYMNTDFWLDNIIFRGIHPIHWSYITWCKTSLSGAGKMPSLYRCCPNHYNYCSLQQFSQPTIISFLARLLWFVHGKMCIFAIQFV